MPDTKVYWFAILHTAVAGITGCNGTSDTTFTEPENGSGKILTVHESGGCTRIGPNCAVRTLFANGTVHASRNGENRSPAPEVTGYIDTALAENWQLIVEDTDFEVLVSTLPAGECAGCVDGVDYEYTIYTANNLVTLNSIEYNFDPSYQFFYDTEQLYRVMSEAAPLIIRQYQR